ncbi:MAG: sterol desaturase family protein [Bacteroidia bacterium]|nr:sterol desaturase family protein [Bacteroidia bacterium]
MGLLCFHIIPDCDPSRHLLLLDAPPYALEKDIQIRASCAPPEPQPDAAGRFFVPSFEAVIEVAILPLMVLTIPMHTSVIGLFGLYMIIMNVVGHLGFELLPSRFIQHPVLRWFNTSTHHNMHHHYGRSNYGLYFNFWDRLFGTNHERYEQEFARTHEREKSEHVCADSKAIVGLRKHVVD